MEISETKHGISKEHKHRKCCLIITSQTRAPCVAFSKTQESSYLCFSSYKSKQRHSICRAVGCGLLQRFFKRRGSFKAESPVKSIKNSIYIQFPKEMIHSANIYGNLLLARHKAQYCAGYSYGRHDPCLTSYYEAACVMCQKPGTN